MGTRTVRFASATVVALCVTTVGSLSIPAASAGSPAAQKKGARAAAEVSIRGVAMYPVRADDLAGGLMVVAIHQNKVGLVEYLPKLVLVPVGMYLQSVAANGVGVFRPRPGSQHARKHRFF